ncbi:macrophage mannose receptor 1-like isoform X4 [Ostrinia furnacalis]|uniref:macrophage mannose receptor 1-like isoform X4 n=1 Tax=Ostrinia furnacalis TaxID=93504 RepID=UPI00103F2F3D|nr:macrophage mannose receptor 1-like isoform X4 [Ostrinia furnacalis]
MCGNYYYLVLYLVYISIASAVLASPLNANLQTAIARLTAGVSCPIFTGIHATISKGDFTSIEAKIPVQWAMDEPDNFQNQEDCTIMLHNGTLADVRCNDTYPYVCYKKKTNNPVMNTNCGTIDPAYTFEQSTGSCYKFHRLGRSWRRAQMTCLAEGGYLAIPNSDQEATILKNLIAQNPANTIIVTSNFRDVVSIGFLDWDQKGTWYTVNGQSIQAAGYASWANGQPDNTKSIDNGSYCGAMFRSGLLDDVWCESVPFAFICEKAPDNSLVPDDEEYEKQ